MRFLVAAVIFAVIWVALRLGRARTRADRVDRVRRQFG